MLKPNSHFITLTLNPIQDGLFRGSSLIGEQKCPLPQTDIYPTMIKPGTIMAYLEKI